jgi:hypothetical protein
MRTSSICQILQRIELMKAFAHLPSLKPPSKYASGPMLGSSNLYLDLPLCNGLIQTLFQSNLNWVWLSAKVFHFGT